MPKPYDIYHADYGLERVPSSAELIAAVSALTGIAYEQVYFSTALQPWASQQAAIDDGTIKLVIESEVIGGEFPFVFEMMNFTPIQQQHAPYKLEGMAQLAEHLGCAVISADCTHNPYRYVWVAGYNHIMTVAVDIRASTMGEDLYLRYAAPTLYIKGNVRQMDFLTAIIKVFGILPDQLAIDFVAPTEDKPVVVYPRPETRDNTPYFQPVLFLPRFTDRVSGDIELALKLSAELRTDIWVNLHECARPLMLVVRPDRHMRRAHVEIDGDPDNIKALHVLEYLDE